MYTISKPSAPIKLALALALSGLLIGCGASSASSPATAQPTSAPRPTVAATVAPTTMPTVVPTAPAIEPTLAPTTAPTAAPAEQGLLPAPLYYITNSPNEPSHIMRLERDGTTHTALLDEAPAKDILTITEFDVSPADGSLAYIVQSQNGNSLIKTDPAGKRRTVLLADASVNTPRWSPDGKMIAVGIFQAPDATSGLAGGVYVIPAGGGEPKLLQANDQIKDQSNPSPDARGFAPKTWSPDGTRLMLGTFSLSVEICGTAVKDLATGALIDLVAPERLAACGAGAWSPDSTAIYIGMTRPGYLAPVPGLWRADAATGKTAPFIAGEPEKGIFRLVRGVQPLGDGSAYAFVATTDKLPDPGEDPNAAWPQFVLARVSSDGATIEQLNEAVYENPGDNSLWARDASGALVEQYDAQANTLSVVWAPAEVGPSATIANDLNIGNLRWGPR
jgi:Tol biopolymer transport system component